MGAVFFYHLTETPLERALPLLVGKAVQGGYRVLLRTVDDARANWLDDKLWTDRDDSFLPHGCADDPFPEQQPVLITHAGGNLNQSDCLMVMDNADLTPDEIASFRRVCVLFDGNDPQSVARARDQWRVFSKTPEGAQYWAQDGGWVKKAESAPQAD
ncbi:MAG: DNA polymerase III subunit chi [Halocynthiibacter sp.]